MYLRVELWLCCHGAWSLIADDCMTMQKQPSLCGPCGEEQEAAVGTNQIILIVIIFLIIRYNSDNSERNLGPCLLRFFFSHFSPKAISAQKKEISFQMTPYSCVFFFRPALRRRFLLLFYTNSRVAAWYGDIVSSAPLSYYHNIISPQPSPLQILSCRQSTPSDVPEPSSSTTCIDYYDEEEGRKNGSSSSICLSSSHTRHF